MNEPRPLEESLIAMAGILVTAPSLEKTLRQILELAFLMAQHHCTPGEAGYLLAAASQRNRLTSEEVAADLVERTSSQEPPP